MKGNLDGTFRAAVSATDSPPADDLPGLQVFSARRGARQEGPNDELENAIVLGAIFSVLLLTVCLNIATCSYHARRLADPTLPSGSHSASAAAA